MPKMGDAMEEGTLIEWLKKEGDSVKSGEVIGNIQTDKATVELTAPSTGTLSGLLISEGDTIPVGLPMAAILKEGESLPSGWGNSGVRPAAAVPRDAEVTAKDAVPDPPSVPPTGKAGRTLASPLAKRLAEDAGIDLKSIPGTGPNGRIVERDVRAAIASGPKVALAPTIAPSVSMSDSVVALNPLRKITAQRTAQSKSEVPHYYVTSEVDLTVLEQLRNQMKSDDPDSKISINDFILRACVVALQEQPHINASFDNGSERRFGSINLGVAVAVPDGLTVPVLKNCESKTLRQLAVEVRSLATRARENKLLPDELVGSTFTISNMGMFDVENFAAIINQPNGAILAVSTAKRAPVVVGTGEDERLEIRTMMKMTGSFDHRIIDGAVGAQFMRVLKATLEAPTRLLS